MEARLAVWPWAAGAEVTRVTAEEVLLEAPPQPGLLVGAIVVVFVARHRPTVDGRGTKPRGRQPAWIGHRALKHRADDLRRCRVREKAAQHRRAVRHIRHRQEVAAPSVRVWLVDGAEAERVPRRVGGRLGEDGGDGEMRCTHAHDLHLFARAGVQRGDKLKELRLCGLDVEEGERRSGRGGAAGEVGVERVR